MSTNAKEKPDGGRMTQKWEYKHYSLGPRPQEAMDRLGAEGWELVCVDPTTAAFVFKRPKTVQMGVSVAARRDGW